MSADAAIGADDVLVLGGDTGAAAGGGHAYLGGPEGGFFGPQHPPGYRLELRNGAGDRLGFDGLVTLSVKRRHTALSDFSATVETPPNETLTDWLLSEVRLAFGDTVLFRGRLDTVNGDLFAPTVELSGRGIGVDLLRGDLTLSWRNTPYWRAIREVWRQHSAFSVTVLQPEDTDAPGNADVPDGEEYSGTPMEILTSLHEDAGMRFTILHSQPGKTAVSYPRGAIRRDHSDDWDVLDGSREASAQDYANRVVVTGALIEGATGTGESGGEGERVRAVAADTAEIEAMRANGVGNDGRVTYPIRDESIGGALDQRDDGVTRTEYHENAEQEALTKAKSKLADLVDKDTVGGQLQVWPTVAAPGYEYYIEQFRAGDGRTYGEGAYGSGAYGTPTGNWASLESVNYSAGRGERSCALDFAQTDDFSETISTVGRER